jgi:hypothetical protein
MKLLYTNIAPIAPRATGIVDICVNIAGRANKKMALPKVSKNKNLA